MNRWVGRMNEQKEKLISEYHKLKEEEKTKDSLRWRYLPKTYYAAKLYEMHIVNYTLEYIQKILTYYLKYDKR